MDYANFLPYLLLLFALLSLWIKQAIKVWGSISVLVLILGIFTDRITFTGTGFILGLAACYYLAQKPTHKPLRISAGVLGITLSAALAAHLLPGFNNLPVIKELPLSEISLPYTMYLNLDKPFIGLFILGFSAPLINTLNEWNSMRQKVLPVFCAGLIILVACGYVAGYLRFDPKWPRIFWLWALHNLFFTCISEEAFFRGFLQRNLAEILQRYHWGDYLSIATAGILFGAAHFAGGLKYVLLATIAGGIYGYAYYKTQKIEAAITCHFGINLFHFIFLTYPALLPPTP